MDECTECMEMPTPCDKCGEWFDLTDGVGFGNIVYCEDCGTKLNNEKSNDY